VHFIILHLKPFVFIKLRRILRRNLKAMKNIKVRYYLEPKARNVEDRTKPELIMAEIGYGYAVINTQGKKRNTPARLSLQESILPVKFGKKEDNFKFDEGVFKRANSNNSTIKTKMLQFERVLDEIAIDYTVKRTTPTPTELKSRLASKLRSEMVVAQKLSILDFMYGKIQKEKENSGKSMKKSKVGNTIKTYVTVSHLIENYQIATKEKLAFEDFNETKYWGFWDVLDDILKDNIKVINPNQKRKQRKQSYGYLVVSIRKYQKAMLSTLREAVKEGHKIPLDVHDVNLILEDVDAVKNFYVDTVLIKQIIDADVTFDEKLQSAKDYFIIASLTGMRYESMEDAQRIEILTCNDSKYKFDYIHSIHNKTTTQVYIPFLKPVQDVIIRNGLFPKIVSNGEVNKCLKLLFKHLQLNRLENVKKVTYRSGTILAKEPMSDLISSHDCKGTFYSNLYGLNVPDMIIDNITHPDRKPKNAMAKIYNKTTMLTKAKLFVDEIIKIDSDVYTF
jgi:hypothetical protein